MGCRGLFSVGSGKTAASIGRFSGQEGVLLGNKYSMSPVTRTRISSGKSIVVDGQDLQSKGKACFPVEGVLTT
jgi:hypothetical protein